MDNGFVLFGNLRNLAEVLNSKPPMLPDDSGDLALMTALGFNDEESLPISIDSIIGNAERYKRFTSKKPAGTNQDEENEPIAKRLRSNKKERTVPNTVEAMKVSQRGRQPNNQCKKDRPLSHSKHNDAPQSHQNSAIESAKTTKKREKKIKENTGEKQPVKDQTKKKNESTLASTSKSQMLFEENEPIAKRLRSSNRKANVSNNNKPTLDAHIGNSDIIDLTGFVSTDSVDEAPSAISHGVVENDVNPSVGVNI